MSPIQYARESVVSARAENWQASWAAISALDVQSKLSRITVPVKIIAGELDQSCPPDLMKRDIADRIRDSKFYVIPGAAHMLSLEKSSELLTLLLLTGPNLRL